MAVKKSGTTSRKSSGSTRSTGAKSGGSSSKGRSKGSTSTSAKAGLSLSGVLDKVGADSVIDVWRDRVSGPVGKQIDKIDIKEALEKAREYASMSAGAIKKAGGKNPKMFYSGLAAILVGAGLIASARGGKAKSRGSSSSSKPAASSASEGSKGGSKSGSRSGSKKGGTMRRSSSRGSSGQGSSGTESSGAE